MKELEFTDERGYRQRAVVRDDDTDPYQGIPLAVPDLDRLDWDGIKHRLHGLLLDKNLLTLADVQQRQPVFIECITTALKRPLLRLYQQENPGDDV